MTQPTPDPISCARHEQLTELVRQDIERSGGFITFARFMQLALYHPELGYYSTNSPKFGLGGDFTTAPQISPLFSQCVARQFQQILAELGRADVLEIGAGSGIFAKEVLLELEKLGKLPENYYIFEISRSLRQAQQDFLKDACPHLFERIHWLDALPTNFRGIIFANEVMDALPVHCFRIDEQIKERSITWKNHQFEWVLTTPSEDFSSYLEGLELLDGYESEINLALPEWIASLANCLKQGVILLFDYGYGRREYYHPDRNQGTLMCFYQHHSHSNPLIQIGLQDITAHVDFTHVIESAMNSGLFLSGYSTQSLFLLACGLLDLAKTDSAIEQYQQSQSIKKLTLPSQMGELIKVMALQKNFDVPLLGFSLNERKQDL